MTAARPPQVCPLCHVAPRATLRLANNHDLLRCPACRLGWWNWPPFEPAAFYDHDYFQSASAQRGYDDYASLEPGVRRTARSRLRRIGRLFGPRSASESQPHHLLDLGCGTGVFLDEARRAGWSVQGAEVSEYAVSQALRRGLSVRSAPLEDLEFPPQSFDCITLWDVLEHLRDPLLVVRRAAAALRPGGVLALSTGNLDSFCARVSGARWHLFNLPEHLFFFTPTALRRTYEQAGLQPPRLVNEVNWAPLSYLFERLRKSHGGASPRSSSTPSGGWVVPATLFDVLGAYACRAT